MSVPGVIKRFAELLGILDGFQNQQNAQTALGKAWLKHGIDAGGGGLADIQKADTDQFTLKVKAYLAIWAGRVRGVDI